MDWLKREQLKNKIEGKIDIIKNKKFAHKGHYTSYRDAVVEDIVKLCEKEIENES